ncbi:Malonyl CoA-acyl carrier protein transacylase [Actinokineospora spheciospongiae]|uniref:[acyl-carrier-protein] S-malonyltransferase n=1 Tax=Actinokineospora spheciospongiae TaxID=909613 RepID=W7IYE2_9PSEU|nr:ACP S-malonyltransferase [Actinokineospora spheciospongiae]EWC61511.1 Malonyl CoA-acyl carrier protein transacylase [Actinokineospora spheciospongiae]
MVALVFPGQGSQRKGMGAGLFDRYPELTRQAEDVLGWSLRELCADDPDGRLRRTEFAQPALFVVNALTHLSRARELPAPKFLAGHSLGEYDALFAAGCFDFSTGVELVRRRGELMGRAGGGMTAVIGVDLDRVVELLAGGADTGVDIANHNSRTQVVLSGPPEGIRAATILIERDKAARCVPLKVSAAFHSRYMAAAAEEFAAVLAGVTFTDPMVPVISNVTAQPYRPGEVATLLAEQIRRPVRWAESMRHLIDHGVEEVEELGPGRVLAGLWKAAVTDPVPAPTAAPLIPAPRPATPAMAASTVAVPAMAAPTAAIPTAAVPTRPVGLRAEDLGSAEFREDWGVRYAYLAGAMFRGIASTELVIRLGRAGLLGFFGAGGLKPDRVEAALVEIKSALGPDGRYGMNLLHSLDDPAFEDAVVELYLRHGVRAVETAGFTQVTPAVVRFRYHGARIDAAGVCHAPHRVLAKVSRPEVAAAFMRPAAPAVVAKLRDAGLLTDEEARVALVLPVSEDICVEADSGGHTDGGAALTLMPSMLRLRDEVMAEEGYAKRLRVGAAGGVGAPEAVAAMLVLGADFVLTGSVNQCTPESGTSDAVKDILASLDVQDTAYAPAGDMFEIGARVQVVRKGTLFAARGNKLHQLYRRYDSWEEIDERTRKSIEDTYFKRPYAEVWAETAAYHQGRGKDLSRLSGKQKLALAFQWYFARSVRWGLDGVPDQRVNYQIQCGPAIGAFNRFAAGTDLQDWRARHVEVIAERLMSGAAEVLAGMCGGRP